MTARHKSLPDHIERYLGTVQRSWSRDPDGEGMGFQILECHGGELEEARAFCTLGLSRHVLAIPKGKLRQELLVLTPESVSPPNASRVLFDLASSALHHHEAFLRGEVIQRANPIFAGKPFRAFYTSMPVALPDSFSPYKDENGEEVIFAWMIPITDGEANFIRTHGWSKFESLLEAEEADMVDLDREGVVPELAN